MVLDVLEDDSTMLRTPGRQTRRPGACATCRRPITWARLEGSIHDVPLDVDRTGEPKVVKRGRYLQVATTPDALGRRALCVTEAPGQGDLDDHRDTCPGS